MTGMRADDATATSFLTGVFDCSRSQTRWCNWLAFAPDFKVRPNSDAHGRRQASINRCLSACAIGALTTGARVVCGRVKNLIIPQRLPYIYSSKKSFVSAGQNTLTKPH
jgi:hypothetical protein